MMSPFHILRPLTVGVAAVVLATPSAAQTADELLARGRSERDQGRLEVAAQLFRLAADADPARADAALLLAETLAWQKKFAEAEIVYRRAIDRFGPTRDARLGLGRVVLWSGRYAEARRIFGSILDENGSDVDALEERARSLYWEGDFRGAAREFRRVVALDPDRGESARALAEIRSASAPAYAIRAFHRSDDQPLAIHRAAVDVTLFSDPLTRWIVSAGSWQLDEASEAAPFFGVESAITVPSLRLTIVPALRLLSFPDGEDEVLGSFRIERKLGRAASISAGIARNELLLTAAAADDHPSVTEASVQWDLAGASGLLARARAGSSHFYDGNDGAFADAYVLAPIHRADRVTIFAGMSAAYHDTDESRFRFERVDVSTAPAGGFFFRWRGVYDPYWTPRALREARAIASLGSAPGAPIFWNVQLSGGRARGRSISFGPTAGGDPRPPAPFPFEYERTWTPWTAAAALELPAGAGTRLRFDYEHTSTIYYEADEIRAALVGRF